MPIHTTICKDERGAVAPVVALLLTVLLGFAGLGIEVGLWQLEKRRMQGAADAAASSAAQAVMKGENEGQQARAIAASFGFQNGIDGVTVAVNRPPLSGSKAGVADAVEVIIRKTQSPLLAGFFMSEDVELGARARWPASRGRAAASACWRSRSPRRRRRCTAPPPSICRTAVWR